MISVAFRFSPSPKQEKKPGADEQLRLTTHKSRFLSILHKYTYSCRATHCQVVSADAM